MGRFADLADHFRRRSIALGQEGLFGSLFTRNMRLRTVFSGLASLIDNPNLSVLLEGAQGTGKYKLAEEFLRLENIYRKLLGVEHSKICRVSDLTRSDILESLVAKVELDHPTLFYFPKLENFTLRDQERLAVLLKRQDSNEQNYRLFFGCEQGLAFLVQKGRITTDIVDYLRLHSFYLPRLSERIDDFDHLITELTQRYIGKKKLPKPLEMEYLLQLSYPDNIDSLAELIKQTLTLCPNPSVWTKQLIERAYPHARGAVRTEKILDFNMRVR